MQADPQADPSDRSYGTAVLLCGVFGTLGIHHFYLRDYLHGLADLGLFILMCVFFYQGHVGLALLALLIDGIHTVIIFYYLIIGEWRDGEGRPIPVPNFSKG